MIKLWDKFIVFFTVIFSCQAYCSTLNTKAELQNVLIKLANQAGVTQENLPEISISYDSMMVGSYDPKKNFIILENKLLKLCQTFGTNSINAVTFVIAHEFVHYLKQHGKKHATNFLKYDRGISVNILDERTADIYGLFLSYISGYNNLELSGDLLKLIYREYRINESLLVNYPRLEERINSHEIVLKTVNDLIQLFHSANYLIMLDEPYFAKLCFAKIYEVHPSIEVENNLGVLQLLEAIKTIPYPKYDKFYLPIQLENKSALERKKKARGEDEPMAALIVERSKLIKTSISYFDKAIKKKANYLPAIINKSCAYFYLGGHSEGLKFLQNKKTAFHSPNEKLLYDLLIILFQSTSKSSLQSDSFSQLIDKANESEISIITRELVLLNRRVLLGEEIPKLVEESGLESGLKNLFQEINFSKDKPVSQIALEQGSNTSFAYSNKNNFIQSYIYHQGVQKVIMKYMDSRGLPSVPIVSSFELSMIPYKDILITNEGNLLHFEKSKIIMQVNHAGKVNSVLKYQH